jgi:hypothetical protein
MRGGSSEASLPLLYDFGNGNKNASSNADKV